MESQPRGSGWRSILLLIFSLGGTVLFISAAIGTLVLVELDENIMTETTVAASPMAIILTVSTMIAVGLLLLPVAWLSLGRLRGREFITFSFPALRPFGWIIILSLWILSLSLAMFFHDSPGAKWYVPFLHFFSIATPLYLVVRIGINRIPLGSSQRAWSVFGSGMTLSPLLSVIAEGVVIIFGLIVFGVYLGLNPEIAFEFERLANQIQEAPDLDSMIFLIGPYLKNPLTLLTALSFLSVFVPIIEEIFKSVGVLLVVDRLSTPAQGFALGMVSGAGFALAESLFASVTADDTWALTLGMRAISSAMHMLATGLVGWGIAYARLEKRYFRAFGMLLLAIMLHGAWNAGAVLSMAGGVGVMLSMPEFDALSVIMMFCGVGLIFMLMLGMFAALFLINLRLRTPLQPPPLPTEMGEVPHVLSSGGGGGGVK